MIETKSRRHTIANFKTKIQPEAATGKYTICFVNYYFFLLLTLHAIGGKLKYISKITVYVIQNKLSAVVKVFKINNPL
mgnify:CR=1 FL=1